MTDNYSLPKGLRRLAVYSLMTEKSKYGNYWIDNMQLL
jgi:hypothetical protein